MHFLDLQIKLLDQSGFNSIMIWGKYYDNHTANANYCGVTISPTPEDINSDYILSVPVENYEFAIKLIEHFGMAKSDFKNWLKEELTEPKYLNLHVNHINFDSYRNK